jgi:hypothetical protein
MESSKKFKAIEIQVSNIKSALEKLYSLPKNIVSKKDGGEVNSTSQVKI